MPGITDDQIIELTSARVQEIVIPKIETFIDGVEKEVQKLRLEYVESKQFNSAIQKGLNEMKMELVFLEPMKKQITELYALFFKNGYMAKLNRLSDQVNGFFADRAHTCPFEDDIKATRDFINAQREEAVRRAEGKLHTREKDDKEREKERRATRRWRITAFISGAGLIVSIIIGIVGRVARWW